LADKSSCVHPLRSRSSRTRVPIRFNGKSVFLMLTTVAGHDAENVRLRSQISACQKAAWRQKCR
jgi:hypothetical protein